MKSGNQRVSESNLGSIRGVGRRNLAMDRSIYLNWVGSQFRINSRFLSGAVPGEGDRLADGRHIQGQHDNSVKSYGDPGAIG